MRFRLVVISGFFVFIGLLLIPGIALSGTALGTESVTGISTGSLVDTNSDEFEDFEEELKNLGYSVPSESTVIIDSDGDQHIVFSSEPIPAGKATVDGATVPTLDVAGDIILAEDVTIKTTGDQASFDELESNPTTYEYELVQVDATVAVGSVAAKPTSATTSQTSVVRLNEPGYQYSDLFSNDQPGDLASWGVTNLSENELGDSSEFEARLLESSIDGLSTNTEFWAEGDATVDVEVLPQYGGLATDDLEVTGYELLIVDIEYDSVTLSSPADIRSGEYIGEIVTIESDIVGSSISAQEYLTSISSYGGQSVAVPASPPACIPVTHDLVVHAGMLVDDTAPSAVSVAYAGVSNQIQTTPTEVEEGQYKITGEVVSSSKIAPTLESAYAIRVFDMKRIGDSTASDSVTEHVETEFGAFEQEIEEQLELEEEADEESTGETKAPEDEPYINETELSDGTVDVGDSFEVTVDIWNPNDEGTEKVVTLYADGDPIKTKTANVPIVRGPTTLETSIAEPGTYELRANDVHVGEIDVNESETESTPEGGSGDAAEESESSLLRSHSFEMTGYGLAFVSVAVFTLGVAIETARSIKSRFGSQDPNLIERTTELIIALSLVGFLSSGVLLSGGTGLLLSILGVSGLTTLLILHGIQYIYKSL